MRRTCLATLLLLWSAAAAYGQPAPEAALPPEADTAPAEHTSIPLHRPAAPEPRGGGIADDPAKRIVMSLSVVLGAFFLVAWISRRRGEHEGLPPEAVELLGQVALGPRESARLLRVGGKLVLVASSPHGLTTLTEVEEPEEVDRLSQLCQPLGRTAFASGRRAG